MVTARATELKIVMETIFVLLSVLIGLGVFIVKTSAITAAIVVVIKQLKK